MTPSFLARYRAGESVAVWSELVALGPDVRSPVYLDEAYAVALETMGRVRRNVEAVVERLDRLGYRFWWPEHVFVPPPAEAPVMVAEIEELVGPLPLSLRAFYEVVGSVDLCQSPEQLVHYDRPERGRAPELHVLGEEDPLVVAPLQALLAEAWRQPGRICYCFAPDEFHKANYSGGENYHLWLPNPDADFRIEGMYGIDEYFVAYLRTSLTFGGFRGRVETLPEDDQRCRKVSPLLQIANALAADLLPI